MSKRMTYETDPAPGGSFALTVSEVHDERGAQ